MSLSSVRNYPLLLLLVAGLLLAACSGPGAGASPSADEPSDGGASIDEASATVRVGLIGSFNSIRAGQVLGTFTADGLEVEVTSFRGGAEGTQALAGGGVDLFIGDISHALELNEAGHQVKVIGGSTTKHPYTLIGVRGASDDVADLVGKKVGITSPGSLTDDTMRWLLSQNGLEANSDVELVGIGAGPPMLAAVQNEQVQAGMLFQPFTVLLKEDGYPVVYDLPNELQPFEATVFIAKESYLAENGETVRRFLESVLGVIEQVQTDAEVRSQVAREVFADIDPEIADAAAEESASAWDADGRFTSEAIEKVLEVDAAGGSAESAEQVSAIVDFSYLPQQ